MSNLYVYKTADIKFAQKTGDTDNKKFRGLTKKGGKYFIGSKQLIPQEDIPAFLKSYYDDPSTGFIGRDRMFSKIYKSYLGISKSDVMSFLRNNETSQVHQQVKKVAISRPVVVSGPMKAWGIDLTWLKDVDPDSTTTVLRESQCLLTVIDMFSKKAWVRLLKNKTSSVVATALRSIIAKAGSASTIRTDNGSEFISNEFKKICTEFGIKHIFSDTYSPQQNAMIERFNRSVKMAVYKYMTQWRTQYIDEVTLQKIVGNYNNCIHGTTKQVPNSLHEEQDAEMIAAARGELKYRAKKLIATNQHNFPQLREGDTVRVARVTSGEWRKTRQLKTYSYLSQWFVE